MLQHRMVNSWPLFGLIAALTAAVLSVAMVNIGLATPQATVDMIRLSVQLASPWIFFAFVASPLLQLLRGNTAKWFVRNRRYFGLSFAAGFGWQLVFIIVLLTVYPTYYWEEMHKDSDLVLRVASYVLLIAMTITSFYPFRRRMSQQHWYWLHLFGVWYFWAAIWVSYVELAISDSATVISLVYIVLGLLVLMLRTLAYLKSAQSSRV